MKISEYNPVTSLESGDKMIVANATNTNNNYITYNSLFNQIFNNSRKAIAELRSDAGLAGINTLLTGYQIGKAIGSGILAIPNSGVIYVNKTGEYLVSVFGRGQAGADRFLSVTTGISSTNSAQLTGLGIVGCNFPPRTAADSAIISIVNPIYFGVQVSDNNAFYVRLRVEEL